MQIAIFLIIVAILSTFCGALLYWFAIKYPYINPLWGFPVTLFIIVPAMALGIFIMHKILGI